MKAECGVGRMAGAEASKTQHNQKQCGKKQEGLAHAQACQTCAPGRWGNGGVLPPAGGGAWQRRRAATWLLMQGADCWHRCKWLGGSGWCSRRAVQPYSGSRAGAQQRPGFPALQELPLPLLPLLPAQKVTQPALPAGVGPTAMLAAPPQTAWQR